MFHDSVEFGGNWDGTIFLSPCSLQRTRNKFLGDVDNSCLGEKKNISAAASIESR